MFSLHGDHIQNLSPGVKSYRGNHMGESSLALPFPFERCICITLLQQHYLNDNGKKIDYRFDFFDLQNTDLIGEDNF